MKITFNYEFNDPIRLINENGTHSITIENKTTIINEDLPFNLSRIISGILGVKHGYFVYNKVKISNIQIFYNKPLDKGKKA